MQYLLIDKKDTLTSVSRIIGQQHADSLLLENALERTPKIGEAWDRKCNDIIATTPNEVTAARKITLLNRLTSSQEVFEKACLQDEDEWKVFSALQTFKDALRIPETIQVPYSTRVIGNAQTTTSQASIGNVTRPSGLALGQDDEPVNSTTYRAVMNSLKLNSSIDPSVFDSVNTSPPVKIDRGRTIDAPAAPFGFNLPWGKIQMYSTLLKETMDFPAYPETVDTMRTASYTSMPDIIYQYEPWIVYQSSGPREQNLNFHLHRDMWTGNHLDGKANELIRFCEANTFPDYNGSSVLPPLVRVYIDGSLFISGVVTACNTTWTGPIGLDEWYLEFTLSLSIQEISETALNIRSVRKFGLKGV